MSSNESTPAETRTFVVGSSSYRIAPGSGCRLMTWTLRTASGSREVLYWPEDSGTTPFHKIRGGNPLLFPFAGRTYDRGLENHWRGPDGNRLPMPRHGFCRDGRFAVVEESDSRIAAKLIPTP